MNTAALYLCHSGSKGMKWGIRRYRNKDGTLTPEGRARYGLGEKRRFKVDKDSNLGITNRYQNFAKADRQLKARQSNYDKETSEIVRTKKSTAAQAATVIKRNLGRPVYSISGAQTTAAIGIIEKNLTKVVPNAAVDAVTRPYIKEAINAVLNR